MVTSIASKLWVCLVDPRNWGDCWIFSKSPYGLHHLCSTYHLGMAKYGNFPTFEDSGGSTSMNHNDSLLSITTITTKSPLNLPPKKIHKSPWKISLDYIFFIILEARRKAPSQRPSCSLNHQLELLKASSQLFSVKKMLTFHQEKTRIFHQKNIEKPYLSLKNMKNGLDTYEEYVSENLGYNMIHKSPPK